MEKKHSGFVFWQKGKRVEIGGGPNPRIVSALSHFRQSCFPGLSIFKLARELGYKEQVVREGLEDLQGRGLKLAEYGDGVREYDGEILFALER